MRITAISAKLPQRHTFPAQPYRPRETVTVVLPELVQGGAMTAALLTGRGILVDVVC